MGNVVVELLNTRDVAAGTDSLTGAWLVAHGLADVPEVDVGAVAAFREQLRAALAGEPVSVVGTVTVSLGASGASLEGLGPIERVLAILAADGTSWDRLKVCRAEDCRWAFYDSSRNHSRTWCSMSDCGNRAKARAYRRRQSPNAGA